MNEPAKAYRSGILFGLVAYLCWGLVPAYFLQLKGVPPLEILAHRICWSICCHGFHPNRSKSCYTVGCWNAGALIWRRLRNCLPILAMKRP